MKARWALTIPFLLLIASCGDDDAATTTASTAVPPTTAAPTTTAPATTSTPPSETPPMAPAEVVFEAQTSDGSSIVVASVTLPAPGFIAVHGNADGAPGPVIGHSGILPEGTSTDVTVELDSALEQTDLVFPMAHIDVNGNGVYEFFPPDETTDGPAQTSAGQVAVVGAEVTVEQPEASGAVITIESFSFGNPMTVTAGQEVTIHNRDATAHTWTSNDGLFDSGRIPGGGEFTFSFSEPGEYDFFCAIHPAMTGSIVVTG